MRVEPPVEPPVETVEAPGLLRTSTRGTSLSLGDRACLALARRLRAPALTSDRAWAKVTIPEVTITLIR